MELPDDPIYEWLYPYQRAHVQDMGAAFRKHDAIIEMSDPGTGKTPTTSAIIRLFRRRAFIIAPKSIIESWFEHLALFDVDVIGVANYEMIKLGKYYTSLEQFRAGSDYAIHCPYVRIHRRTFAWTFPRDTAVVLDEAHAGKNTGTITADMFRSFVAPVKSKSIKLVLLSATIVDRLECFHVFAMMLGLAQEGEHAYKAWLRVIQMRSPGKTLPEILHAILIPEYGGRMAIRDIMLAADIFKNNTITAVIDEVSPELEADIESQHDVIAAALAELRVKQARDRCVLTIILRARQRIEMLKIPLYIRHAIAKLDAGRAPVIFVNFNETVDNITIALDEYLSARGMEHVALIRGGQTTQERSAEIARFQSGQCHACICNMASGSVAISLHHVKPEARPRTSIISQPWSSTLLKQVLGRIHRAGALSDSEQLIIYCRGKTSPGGFEDTGNDTTFDSEAGKVGVEVLMAIALNKKLHLTEWLNNGDGENLFQLTIQAEGPPPIAPARAE